MSNSTSSHLSQVDKSEDKWALLGFGLGLATCSTLLFEIVLTRIFSVLLWYHYGFMVVSLALMGIGLAGIFVYLHPERFPREHVARLVSLSALAYAVSLVAAIFTFHALVTLRTSWPLSTPELALVFMIMLVPFFFAGLCAAIPLSRYPEKIGPLYAADLAGAAVGTVLVIPLLSTLGGHRTILVCAALAAASGVVFALARPHRRGLMGSLVVLGVILATIPFATRFNLFTIKYSKKGEERNVLAERWNSFSRVTVHSGGLQRFAWNLSRKAPPIGAASHLIRIDGGAGTPIVQFDGKFDRLEYLRFDVASIGYQVRPQNDVLIIGAGGGRDILTARLFDVERIHAVEINPTIVDLVQNEFESFSGNPYQLPGTAWSIMDGRSYLTSSMETFDHIQLSAVDTIAASAAGALALVEQSLYTVEAFLDYHDHLTEDGILSITRPFRADHLPGTLRMIDLFRTSWTQRGHEGVERHLVVIGNLDAKRSVWGTLLASRSPFSREEIASLLALCEELGFNVLYAPGSSQNIEEIEAVLGPDREQFFRDYPKNCRATTDDWPFFFYFRKASWLLTDEFRRSLGQRAGSIVGPDILTMLFLIVAVLTFLLSVALPMALGRLKLGAARGSGIRLLYFAGIGLGFIIVEIALMLRYSLLVGRPLYSFAIILGSLLIFSGLGSLFTHLVSDERLLSFTRLALGLVVVGIVLHTFLGPAWIYVGMRWSLPVRISLIVSTLAPLALLMGMALPSGMRLLNRTAPKALPWAWGVNGAFSVLGTVIAMSLAVFFGLKATLLAGAGAYALAAITPWWLPRR